MTTALIHTAMTAAAGDRDKAAAALGITRDALNNVIRATSELTILWPPVGPQQSAPVLVEALDRDHEPTTLPPVDPRDAALAEGLGRQELKLQKFDWEGMGVKNAETIKLMGQFERSVGGGVIRILDAMHGGMAFCFAQVSARFAQAAAKLEEPAVIESPQLYAYWHNMFMDYAREMKGFNKEATTAAHTRLLIAERARKMRETGGGATKAGWGARRPIPVGDEKRG